MKKIAIYIGILILIVFLIPIIFTRQLPKVVANPENKQEENKVEQNKEQDNNLEAQETQSNYDYKNYMSVKLLHSKTNEIETIKLDEYLYHVVSAEMPADFSDEALKAQAVVARTYTIYKIINNKKKHGEADICDNSACCQAWISKEDRLARWDEQLRQSNWNKIVNAVNTTQGKIITYDKQPINAFFHSNSGGKTEAPINVWGGSGYPYLQVVETSGEDAYTQYYSEIELSKSEFESKIKQKHSNLVIDFSKDDCIKIIENTDGGRVRTLKVGNLNLSGVEIRTILGLKSANFTIEIKEDIIKFSVVGYGHGVGMSQTGADALAKQGSNYEDIIKHFYVGVEIIDI